MVSAAPSYRSVRRAVFTLPFPSKLRTAPEFPRATHRHPALRAAFQRSPGDLAGNRPEIPLRSVASLAGAFPLEGFVAVRNTLVGTSADRYQSTIDALTRPAHPRVVECRQKRTSTETLPTTY